MMVQAAAPRSTGPLKVSAPVLTRSPRKSSPLMRTSLAKVRAAVESLAIVGSLMQIWPVPKAVSEPA